VKIGRGKIDDLFAPLISDVGIANIPFARHDPIKNLGSRRYLENIEGNVCSDSLERTSYAITRDTPADWKYVSRCRVNFFTYAVSRD